MTQTINSYQVAAFTVPVNGQPADAAQVLGNDNTVRTAHNSHDADSGIHFQSSALAARPAAGTVNRKWFSTDDLHLWYDDGATWQQAAYVPSGTVSNSIAINANGGWNLASSQDAAGASTINFTATGATAGIRLNASGATGYIAFNTGTGGQLRFTIDASGNLLGAAGVQLLKNTRQTGWTAATGTPTRTTFATGSVTLSVLAEHVKAIIDDLITHGLIGT